MQPVCRSPRFAFASESRSAPASLSSMATVPAANELLELSVESENADHVAEPDTSPMAATRSSVRYMRGRLAATLASHDGRAQLERDVGHAAPVVLAGALGDAKADVDLEAVPGRHAHGLTAPPAGAAEGTGVERASAALGIHQEHLVDVTVVGQEAHAHVERPPGLVGHLCLAAGGIGPAPLESRARDEGAHGRDLQLAGLVR